MEIKLTDNNPKPKSQSYYIMFNVYDLTSTITTPDVYAIPIVVDEDALTLASSSSSVQTPNNTSPQS